MSYQSEDGFNFDGIDALTPINQIERIEKQNEMAINVFGYENEAIVPYRLSEQPATCSMARINLLLIYEEPKSHYVWIKDLNRLLSDQTKYDHRKHFCERCLHGYSREDLLQRHIPECKGIGDRAVRIEMPIPERNDILKFNNLYKRMKVPFVMYADFEAIIKKIDDCSKTNTRNYLHLFYIYFYICSTFVLFVSLFVSFVLHPLILTHCFS